MSQVFEPAASGRSKCRGCGQAIPRGNWRVRLVFYEKGRFAPGGFVHLDCRNAYFETDDILDQLLYFSPALSAGEREELRLACSTVGDARPPKGSTP